MVWDCHVTVAQGYSRRYYYPLRLVNRAAQLMEVNASQFTSTINLASKYHKEQQNDEERTLELFC